MKTITLFTSVLIMALLSFSTFAASSNLDQAIQHAEAAIKSEKGKSVAEHAAEAKKYANASKSDTSTNSPLPQLSVNCSHLDSNSPLHLLSSVIALFHKKMLIGTLWLTPMRLDFLEILFEATETLKLLRAAFGFVFVVACFDLH